MKIDHARTDSEIESTFDVMAQLRPDLVRAEYVARVKALRDTDGFRLVRLLDDGEVRAVAGYRVMSMLYCDRLLYVDDLVTDARVRSRGYGSRLLEWLKDEARAEGCAELQLISRVVREQAHRFYFRHGLGIECFHFRIRLADGPVPES